MRRTILPFLLAAALSAQQQPVFVEAMSSTLTRKTREVDEQCKHALELDKHFDVYLRSLFGCPATGAVNDANCHQPGIGVKGDEYLKARAAAKKLFGFKEDR